MNKRQKIIHISIYINKKIDNIDILVRLKGVIMSIKRFFGLEKNTEPIITYNALDVANFLINYGIERENYSSNLRIQKILYYVQAGLLLRGKSEIKDEFLAWQYGPVIKAVYDEYKRYYNKDIKEVVKTEGEIRDEDKKLMKEIYDNLNKKDPWELVDMTHEELPWKLTDINDTISKGKIKNYFKEEENFKDKIGVEI